MRLSTPKTILLVNGFVATPVMSLPLPVAVKPLVNVIVVVDTSTADNFVQLRVPSDCILAKVLSTNASDGN
jgi:hypothetical protein